MAGDYLRGLPDLNWVCWFLVCLFVCEVLASMTLARIPRRSLAAVFGFVCLLSGVWACNHSLDPDGGIAYEIARTWFAAEAIVALGFYALGYAAWPLWQRLLPRRRVLFTIGTLALGVMLLTYPLNHAAGSRGVVVMAIRDQGNPLYFTLTALAGTLALSTAGLALQNLRFLCALGRQTLPLLGLNGLFYHHINQKIGQLWPVSDSFAAVLLEGLLFSVLSLLVCMPIATVLNRLLPQLMGRSRQSGPWLPPFEPSSHQSQPAGGSLPAAEATP